MFNNPKIQWIWICFFKGCPKIPMQGCRPAPGLFQKYPTIQISHKPVFFSILSIHVKLHSVCRHGILYNSSASKNQQSHAFCKMSKFSIFYWPTIKNTLFPKLFLDSLWSKNRYFFYAFLDTENATSCQVTM